MTKKFLSITIAVMMAACAVILPATSVASPVRYDCIRLTTGGMYYGIGDIITVRVHIRLPSFEPTQLLEMTIPYDTRMFEPFGEVSSELPPSEDGQIHMKFENGEVTIKWFDSGNPLVQGGNIASFQLKAIGEGEYAFRVSHNTISTTGQTGSLESIMAQVSIGHDNKPITTAPPISTGTYESRSITIAP